jgi:hypothetical protein
MSTLDRWFDGDALFAELAPVAWFDPEAADAESEPEPEPAQTQFKNFRFGRRGGRR